MSSARKGASSHFISTKKIKYGSPWPTPLAHKNLIHPAEGKKQRKQPCIRGRRPSPIFTFKPKLQNDTTPKLIRKQSLSKQRNLSTQENKIWSPWPAPCTLEPDVPSSEGVGPSPCLNLLTQPPKKMTELQCLFKTKLQHIYTSSNTQLYTHLTRQKLLHTPSTHTSQDRNSYTLLLHSHLTRPLTPHTSQDPPTEATHTTLTLQQEQ